MCCWILALCGIQLCLQHWRDGNTAHFQQSIYTLCWYPEERTALAWYSSQIVDRFLADLGQDQWVLRLPYHWIYKVFKLWHCGHDCKNEWGKASPARQSKRECRAVFWHVSHNNPHPQWTGIEMYDLWFTVQNSSHLWPNHLLKIYPTFNATIDITQNFLVLMHPESWW
jgi:hypothetical protein